MNQGLIPARYAKALYEFASENSLDTQVFECMSRLCEAFASEPALNKTMSNPFVSRKDKSSLIVTACNPSEQSAKVIDSFIRLLVENNRLDMVREIALAYLGIYRKEHDIRLVSVSSAAPMEAAEEQRLKELIKRHLGAAEMEYRHSVDPELIGGFTVSIDNERLDASVANELKQLRRTLLSK